MRFKKKWLFLVENFNEIFVSSLFVIFSITMYYSNNYFKNGGEYDGYAMPSVALFGIFLAWIQFLFYKRNGKKRAALTYLPNPIELEGLESTINAITGFFSNDDPLDKYQVGLMVEERIDDDEYKLIWKRISITNKNKIIKDVQGKRSANKDYDPKYNLHIDELYRKARSKLVAYLNLIEGYCLAVNKGNIDIKSSKGLFAYKFGNYFRKAKPFIDKARSNYRASTLFIELEGILKKWEDM